MRILVDLLWGYHVIALIFITGVKLSLQTKFFQIRTFFKMLKEVFSKEKEHNDGISSFQALATALAGSIGTGNIVGVGLAISVGGAGAIFWMWVSALFGMMTVFAEVVLSVHYKKDGSFGAFSYIEKIGKGKILPFVYGLGCVLSSLAMGNMAQANSVAAASQSFGVPLYVTAVILALVMFVITAKGLNLVAKLSEKIVPLMTIIFFFFSIVCIYKCRANLPNVFAEIFESAFSLKGGLSGTMLISMRVGISRGVFTNEAGLGTSSMAFSNVKNKSAVQLGYLGIFQVFLDTTVMCTITGLCILCGTSERNGDFLVRLAFENSMGEIGLLSINICMALFAFATMTATSYYGKVGLAYISKNKLNFIFPYLFMLASFFGAIMPLQQVFELCDAFNGLLAIPNLIAISYFSNKFTNYTNKTL